MRAKSRRGVTGTVRGRRGATRSYPRADPCPPTAPPPPPPPTPPPPPPPPPQHPPPPHSPPPPPTPPPPPHGGKLTQWGWRAAASPLSRPADDGQRSRELRRRQGRAGAGSRKCAAGNAAAAPGNRHVATQRARVGGEQVNPHAAAEGGADHPNSPLQQLALAANRPLRNRCRLTIDSLLSRLSGMRETRVTPLAPHSHDRALRFRRRAKDKPAMATVHDHHAPARRLSVNALLPCCHADCTGDDARPAPGRRTQRGQSHV